MINYTYNIHVPFLPSKNLTLTSTAQMPVSSWPAAERNFKRKR